MRLRVACHWAITSVSQCRVKTQCASNCIAYVCATTTRSRSERCDWHWSHGRKKDVTWPRYKRWPMCRAVTGPVANDALRRNTAMRPRCLHSACVGSFSQGTCQDVHLEV